MQITVPSITQKKLKWKVKEGRESTHVDRGIKYVHLQNMPVMRKFFQAKQQSMRGRAHTIPDNAEAEKSYVVLAEKISLYSIDTVQVNSLFRYTVCHTENELLSV